MATKKITKIARPKDGKAPRKRSTDGTSNPTEAPQVGAVLYLRGTSRHWPRKIGKFLFSESLGNLWVYEGRIIPMEEWNARAEGITDEFSRDHGGMLTPCIKLHPVPEPPTKVPTWRQNLDKARKPKPPEDLSDEQPGTSEPPPSETLY